jgi:hypothetical protein
MPFLTPMMGNLSKCRTLWQNPLIKELRLGVSHWQRIELGSSMAKGQL